MRELAKCRSERCGREILWCSIDGAPVPLDPEPVPKDVSGVVFVAYHEPSGRGRGYAHFAVDAVPPWVARDDVTVHTRHHSTCPGVREFDVNPNQEKLL